MTGLDRLSAEELQARYSGTHWDRVMLVTIARQGARFDIAGRPYNATTRTLGPVAGAGRARSTGLPTVVGRLVRDMFAPTVQITVGGAKEVEVEVRAGEFPVADPDSEQLQLGT
ncbi:MAG: hypothetical protein CM1200mP2_35740 [Planctomycetaceae bacterium]|nr:MAG: hypothetical protein CM1200mP2_35740 [Planctomycetaceae bacterium]